MAPSKWLTRSNPPETVAKMAERNSIRIGWPFRKLERHPLLEAILDKLPSSGETVHVGWGMRPSGQAAAKASRSTGGKLLLLEDAFLRSLKPGMEGPVYGLIADSQGMHYDVSGRSDLIDFLNAGELSGWMNPGPFESDSIAAVMTVFREAGASKYNWFPGEYSHEALEEKPGILVVDQTRGDMAIRRGGLAETDFDRMLRAAFEETAGQPIYLRAHPDHLFRAKKTCFSKDLLSDSRIRLLSPHLSPAQCFSFCHTVMVGTSQMGMEALIHGCRVITYGWPFFAGWGLTEDRANPGLADRRRPVTLESLFEAAFLRYAHYFDPESREPCGLRRILDHLCLQKETFRSNRGLTVTVGFTPWQRQIASHYFRSPAGAIEHLPSAADVEHNSLGNADRVVYWGRRPEIPESIRSRAARVEDGFIRSNGLGAAFNFPFSWVIDHQGIYFDGSAPSDLEHLLQQGFSEADLAQASRLIAMLREKRLTKYNLQRSPVELDSGAVAGRKVILVPGQVEADASIAFGSPELKTNLALLQRVREMEPAAFLVFKAHPDLVAGARHGKVLPPGFTDACDLAVTEGNVLDWLDLCDEVHTMTSTVGFEALIRGKPVVTYGLPFYAGWGLTTDRLSCPRRRRRLTIDELVCGALIRYPRYLHPGTGEFTTALLAAEALSRPAADQRPWHLKTLSKLKKAWVELSRC